MLRKSIIALFAVILTAVLAARQAGAVESASSVEMLKSYVAELKRTPEDRDLRETIIKLAQTLKPKPQASEEFERALSRGNAYMNTATDAAGYKKAVSEYQAAISAAPWAAEGYLSLSKAQEKAGLYADAVQSLKFYQLASPQAKGSREIKNKIYEMEVYAEEARKGKKKPPEPQVAEKPAAAPVEMPKQKGLDGSWYIKDTGPRGDEILVHAFTLKQTAGGEMNVELQKRTANSIGSVATLDVSGNKMKIVLIWELSNTPGYWKTEFFDLTLSDDEQKLTGTFFMQSSKYAEDTLQDVVLIRQ